ncbi:IS630 family transposase [Pendulispora albinea]|uniref:IS630 family transposase n=1 Tax=Pendulispora albinea TaxID=2741071 RepID=A0ABZ2M748_9BACT
MISAGYDHPVETARGCSSCSCRRAFLRRNREAARDRSGDGEPNPAAAPRNELARAEASRRWQHLSDSRRNGADACRHRGRDARRDGRRTRVGARKALTHANESLRCAAGAHSPGVLSKKKSFLAAERNTLEHRELREAFCALLKNADLNSLVFIDESFVKTGMRREYARSLRGHRVTGSRPFRSWKTLSLIGAIRLGEKPKIMTSKAAVNGTTFLRFIKHRLSSWLYPGDIVIMDNLSIHKMLLVREAILDAGGFPVYLPTYSPELNPIERLWADMKRRLRTLALDAQDELLRTVRRLRASTPITKIAAWFRHSLSEARFN